MNSALAEKLEVWGFEEGKLIFKDLSLGAVLKVSQKDISTATDTLLNSMHSATADFLNGLPAGLSIQFVQEISGGYDEQIDRHSAGLVENAPELARKLLQTRTELLRGSDQLGEIPNQKLYLLLRCPFVKEPPQQKRGLKSGRRRRKRQVGHARFWSPRLSFSISALKTSGKALKP